MTKAKAAEKAVDLSAIELDWGRTKQEICAPAGRPQGVPAGAVFIQDFYYFSNAGQCLGEDTSVSAEVRERHRMNANPDSKIAQLQREINKLKAEAAAPKTITVGKEDMEKIERGEMEAPTFEMPDKGASPPGGMPAPKSWQNLPWRDLQVHAANIREANPDFAEWPIHNKAAIVSLLTELDRIAA